MEALSYQSSIIAGLVNANRFVHTKNVHTIRAYFTLMFLANDQLPAFYLSQAWNLVTRSMK